MTGWKSDGAAAPLTRAVVPKLRVLPWHWPSPKNSGFIPALLTLLPHHTMEAFCWIIPNLAASQQLLLSWNTSKSQTLQLHKEEEFLTHSNKFLHRKFRFLFFSELTSHNKPQGSTMHLQLQQKWEFAFLKQSCKESRKWDQLIKAAPG